VAEAVAVLKCPLIGGREEKQPMVPSFEPSWRSAHACRGQHAPKCSGVKRVVVAVVE